MKNLKPILITMALAGFAGGAMAQVPSFASIDADGDGLISAEEAKVVEGLDIEALDTNGDGALSPAEYAAAMK